MNQEIVKVAGLEGALLALYNKLQRLAGFSADTLAEAERKTSTIDKCTTLLLARNLFKAESHAADFAEEINEDAKVIQTTMAAFLLESTISTFVQHPLFSSDQFDVLVSIGGLEAELKAYSEATTKFSGFAQAQSAPFVTLKAQGPENVDQLTFENLANLRRTIQALETAHAQQVFDAVLKPQKPQKPQLQHSLLEDQASVDEAMEDYNRAGKAFNGFAERGFVAIEDATLFDADQNVATDVYGDLLVMHMAKQNYKHTYLRSLLGSIIAAMKEDGLITGKHLAKLSSDGHVTLVQNLNSAADKFPEWKLASKDVKAAPFERLVTSGVENIDDQTLTNLMILKMNILRLRKV
ncbi:MAG: hypothetical protein S4CHLAM37_12910 [Chlamydiia bacterium]|nr:hypothetical protein [Chlamydiia bacterium]